MSEVVCPYCYQTFLKQNNLNRHLKNSCPVLKASEAMSDLSITRTGRTAERDEGGQGARKKSKSRERGTDATDFEEQTATIAFERMLEPDADVKSIFNGQTPTVKALLTSKFLNEQLNYIEEKKLFDVIETRYLSIQAVFNTLNAPVSVGTTAPAPSSSGMFGNK